jgi:serine protease Do
VKDPDDLRAAVAKFKPQDNVTVQYKRDGKSGEVKATLGERNRMRTITFNDNGELTRSFNFAKPRIPSTPRIPYTMSWGLGRGRLGVTIEDAENDGGAKVIDVDDDSPAAKSGIKENDVITEINGKKIKDVNEARKEIADVKDKLSYNIKAKRSGAEMSFEIKIPKRTNKATL